MDGHEALMVEFEFFKRAKHIKKITEEIYLFVYFIFENTSTQEDDLCGLFLRIK